MIQLKKISWLRSACDRRLFPFCRGIALVLSLISLGCGRDAPNSPTVTPPDPNGAVDAAVEEAPAVSTAPGELELPDIAIPDDPPMDEPAATGGLEMPKNVIVPDQAGASGSTAIQYATWEEIESFARSTGRVTVVDLWSLACEPCLKEFPGLVRIHQTMGTNVQCVAVDLDFDGRKSRPPEYYQQQVVDFLEGVGAEGFPMYISSTPSDDVFAAAKLTSIPAVFVFAADGEVAKVFVDAGDTLGFTYDKDIIPLVTKLVK